MPEADSHAVAASPLVIPDHTLIRCIGQGAYGEVWLARNSLGTLRAVKIVRRADFDDDRPYEREFAGIRRFEPISRSHEGLVDLLQVGRNEPEGWFYYVMELADDVRGPGGRVQNPSSEIRRSKKPQRRASLGLRLSALGFRTSTPPTLSPRR